MSTEEGDLVPVWDVTASGDGTGRDSARQDGGVGTHPGGETNGLEGEGPLETPLGAAPSRMRVDAEVQAGSGLEQGLSQTPPEPWWGRRRGSGRGFEPPYKQAPLGPPPGFAQGPYAWGPLQPEASGAAAAMDEERLLERLTDRLLSIIGPLLEVQAPGVASGTSLEGPWNHREVPRGFWSGPWTMVL
jgi:hypothetical protein